MTERPSWLMPNLQEIEDSEGFPIDRVAIQLSRVCRYAGSTDWSVCQHSLLVLYLLRFETARIQYWGLLHDAHECWIGDMCRPAKVSLGEACKNMEKAHDMQVWRLLGFWPTDSEQETVREYDVMSYKIEMKHLSESGQLFAFDGSDDFRKEDCVDRFIHFYKLLKAELGL